MNQDVGVVRSVDQPALLMVDRAKRIVWASPPATALLELIGSPATACDESFCAKVRCLDPKTGCRCTEAEAPPGVSKPAFHAEYYRPLPGYCLLHLHETEREIDAKRHVQMLAQAVTQAGDAVMITDAHGTIEFINPAFEEITGYSRAEAIGRRANLLNSGQHSAKFFADLWKTVRAGKPFRSVFTNRRKDGDVFFEEKTISPIRDADGLITHYVSTAKDVTARVRMEDRLRHMANYDVLTQLPNRSLLADRLRQAILRAQRDALEVALLFIDLDNFKVINDTLGHAAGDRLLVQVSRRLREGLRQQDTVARLGGDEFILVLEDLTGALDTLAVVEKLQDSFARPFVVETGELYVGLSVGIARYPHDGQDMDTLLKHADIAMYKAKAMGGSTHAFFDAGMSGGMLDDLALETALHGALERGEFHLVYQPLVDARDGQVVGVEALMRWRTADHGEVSPVRFIPLLEGNGLIVPATLWLMREAMGAVGALTRPLRLAINISGRQFRHPRFLDDVGRLLRETGFDPSRLELEMTESILIENTTQVIETLGALREMGIRLAVDDFGTGYSSLSYLRRFSLTTLKIDRSFVAEIDTSADARAIAAAVANLAFSLGLDVVAEGIETVSQLSAVNELGCHLMQGYHFSRPLPLTDLANRWTV